MASRRRPSPARCSPGEPRRFVHGERAFFENEFLENSANFWRARSRLYQNEILQENYAFDSIFQALQDLYPFAPLQSQNFRKKSV